MAQLQSHPVPPTRRRRPQGEPASVGELARATGRGLVGLAITLTLIVAGVAAVMLAVFGPAAPLVVVPEVVGQPEEQARQAIENAGLKFAVVNYKYDPEVKEGDVVAISPYGSKQVRAGREVRATVSRGSRTVTLPNLVGKTIEEASTKLTELDLQLGTHPKQANAKPDNTILRTDPPAGEKLARKTKVNLAVSGGPDYGQYKLPGGKTFLYRTLSLTVPQGPALQTVSVEVNGEDMEQSFLERLCRPGEVVKVDLYGPEGARVRVKIEDERVYSESL